MQKQKTAAAKNLFLTLRGFQPEIPLIQLKYQTNLAGTIHFRIILQPLKRVLTHS